MSAAPRVSVVVVSHQRPKALSLCIKALSQLDFENFEVVVAADAPGLAALKPWDGQIKTVLVPEPGISAARNAGLALAAGDLVAFIDDDAVAEPTWLTHLTAPFAGANVMAAGGFVRGRNGISFQWKARSVDRTGQHFALPLVGAAPSLQSAPPGRAIKLEGTNMAIRREKLAALGGFDPAYRFYLDETDLSMRMADHVTAIVPLAQVHHGFAASARRTAERAPRSLHEIGASTAVFLRKFAPENAWAGALETLRAEQRERLLAHMVRGTLGPGDVAPLMRGLDAGVEEGLLREIRELAPICAGTEPFLPFSARPGQPHHLVSGRSWQAKTLRKKAASLPAPTTLFLFSPSARYHQMRFRPEGFWEQRGGLFGRSERNAPLVQAHSFSARNRQEIARLSTVRPLTPEAEGSELGAR